MRVFCFITDKKIVKVKANTEFNARNELKYKHPKLEIKEMIIKGKVFS